LGCSPFSWSYEGNPPWLWFSSQERYSGLTQRCVLDVTWDA
jgi:hypothetical protein